MAEGPTAEGPARPSPATRTLLLWFLVTRLVVMLAAQLGGAFALDRFKDAWVQPSRFGVSGPPPHALLEPTVRWDAILYIGIARDGYSPPRDGPIYDIAFFPAFPLAVSAVERVAGDSFLAAFLINHLAALLAALLILRLGQRHFPEGVGLRAAMLFLAAPGAGFLSFPYTEALFALWLSAALLSAADDRPLTAGLMGALATATRSTGAVITVILLWSAWQHRHDRRALVRRVIAAGLSTAGLVAFSLFCWQRYGDPLAWMHIQSEWKRQLSVLGPIRAFIAFDHDPDYYLVSIAAIVVAVRAWGRVPRWTSLASWFLLLLPLSTGTLTSMIRFQSNNVPLLLSAGRLLEGRRFQLALLVCGALMIFETFLYARGFAHN